MPLNTDRGVDAESARAMPCEHVGGGGLIEEVVAAEVPEDTLLDRPLELLPVARFELGGLMEMDSAVLGFREDAVEDDESGKGSGHTTAPLPRARKACPSRAWRAAPFLRPDLSRGSLKSSVTGRAPLKTS